MSGKAKTNDDNIGKNDETTESNVDTQMVKPGSSEASNLKDLIATEKKKRIL